jgi:hypothetical protein
MAAFAGAFIVPWNRTQTKTDDAEVRGVAIESSLLDAELS